MRQSRAELRGTLGEGRPRKDRGSNIPSQCPVGCKGKESELVMDNFGKIPSLLKYSEHCYLSEKWCHLEVILMTHVYQLRMLSDPEFLEDILDI